VPRSRGKQLPAIRAEAVPKALPTAHHSPLMPQKIPMQGCIDLWQDANLVIEGRLSRAYLLALGQPAYKLHPNEGHVWQVNAPTRPVPANQVRYCVASFEEGGNLCVSLLSGGSQSRMVALRWQTLFDLDGGIVIILSSHIGSIWFPIRVEANH
jgi:hypothetical protein